MRSMWLAVVAAVVVTGALVSATYDKATIKAVDPPNNDGAIHVVVTCTGNAGEQPISPEFYLQGNFTTIEDIQGQVWRACDAIQRTIVVSKLIVANQQIARPPSAPAPAAEQVFLTDLQRWYHIKAAIDAGILAGTEPEVTAFKSQVQSEYKASYLGAF